MLKRLIRKFAENPSDKETLCKLNKKLSEGHFWADRDENSEKAIYIAGNWFSNSEAAGWCILPAIYNGSKLLTFNSKKEAVDELIKISGLWKR